MADTENFNVASRTAPLDNMNNLNNLERRIPKRLLNVSDGSSRYVIFYICILTIDFSIIFTCMYTYM
jgi:hypothetical protein